MDIEMRGCACVHLNVSTYTYSIVANRLLLMQISIQYMKYLSFRLLQRFKNWKKNKVEDEMLLRSMFASL